MAIRPLIKNIVISKHFIRDLKDKEQRDSIIRDILDCSHLPFSELHRFEEHVNGTLVFRAKKESLHVVYAVDKKTQTIFFLRAIKHFSEYSRFLEDKKRIKKLIESLN
jgi:mRNA-degrading endonuclease RelE of RelBE toxin-antitoxin system